MRSILLLVLLISCAHADKQAWSDGALETPSTPAASVAPADAPATREPPPAPNAEPCHWSAEPVRMDLVRADVRQVLQALADRGRINLVLADDVGGQVTVRLEDVPIDEALVTIATAAGLALDTDRCVTTVASRPSR